MHIQVIECHLLLFFELCTNFLTCHKMSLYFYIHNNPSTASIISWSLESMTTQLSSKSIAKTLIPIIQPGQQLKVPNLNVYFQLVYTLHLRKLPESGPMLVVIRFIIL